MNDIVWTKSYEDYKTEVGQELSRASESFVRIGYLLKVARDTDVLAGTEFEGDYIKFAEREFGLEKTQVSRFIRINDKFSVSGNSEVLKDEFKGYGTRKLGIMLTLPDEIVEELSPDLTVEEIETIQEEVWADIYKMPYPDKSKAETKNQINDENVQKNDDNVQKNDKKGPKLSKKSKVVVTKEKKNAEKERKQETETEGHESAGNGAEERTEQIKDLAAEQGLHDLQPEGSTGESQLSGEENLGGTERESLSPGVGETLPGESEGTSGGEGNDSGTPERNKYSARLENLTWKNGMLIKEINAKDYGSALKSAGDIEQCIQAIIADLKNEEGQSWREV